MRNGLITPSKAYELILGYAQPPQIEQVPLEHSLGRFLARELFYTVAQPPFDKSAMDGYAYFTQDTASPPMGLKLHRGSVAAGSQPGALPEGFCLPIMTGAPIPRGCNAVHRIEYARLEGGVLHFTKKESSRNIIKCGQNAALGTVLLRPMLIGAAELSALASSGYDSVPVAQKIKVGLLSTGSELVPAGQPLPEGCIYDSNSPLLLGLLQSSGAEAQFYGTCPDDKKELLQRLSLMRQENDVIIISGGISMGEYDFTKSSFEDLGVKEVFHGVSIKPGKPLFFGVGQGKAFFGLPGNPVSAFVCFEIFIRPFIQASMGGQEVSKEFLAPLSAPYRRKDASREEYLPAHWVQGLGGPEAEILPYSGSSMLSVLTGADILVKIEEGLQELEKGRLVYARFVQ